MQKKVERGTRARPLLILACGNPSRGDDALGPLLIERLEERQRAGALTRVDLLTDFQLQVEHALDLQGREQVVFVDAAAQGTEPFSLTSVQPEPAAGYSTHAVAPGSVLRVLEQITPDRAPLARLLAIRGYSFELGDPPSDAAIANLAQAIAYLLPLLQVPGEAHIPDCSVPSGA